MWLSPITLSGTHAKLVPLSHDHLSDLQRATEDGALHKLWYTWVPGAAGMAAEIDKRLSLQAAGEMLPFAICTLSGQALGMTTYMNVDSVNHRLEIGSTWLRKSAQRGPVNSECKLMLLEHAFDHLDAIAVEFRTHFLNTQSRRAIERLGAKFDGVLRNHMRMANGTLRDTAVYSILPHEWPAVRAGLELRLNSEA
jgi:RimJ/RimL family protein N-acetyltransferase